MRENTFYIENTHQSSHTSTSVAIENKWTRGILRKFFFGFLFFSSFFVSVKWKKEKRKSQWLLLTAVLVLKMSGKLRGKLSDLGSGGLRGPPRCMHYAFSYWYVLQHTSFAIGKLRDLGSGGLRGRLYCCRLRRGLRVSAKLEHLNPLGELSVRALLRLLCRWSLVLRFSVELRV